MLFFPPEQTPFIKKKKGKRELKENCISNLERDNLERIQTPQKNEQHSLMSKAN